MKEKEVGMRTKRERNKERETQRIRRKKVLSQYL